MHLLPLFCVTDHSFLSINVRTTWEDYTLSVKVFGGEGWILIEVGIAGIVKPLNHSGLLINHGNVFIP